MGKGAQAAAAGWGGGGGGVVGVGVAGTAWLKAACQFWAATELLAHAGTLLHCQPLTCCPALQSACAVNGTPSCASEPLLTGLLRRQLGFGGFVVTDNRGENGLQPSNLGPSLAGGRARPSARRPARSGQL